ncbi:hypothetical protein GOP47_0017747 [Adiantum capillus-veneris]|uniref:HMA domain-containing protein n=1 Tax=Adiantum capillus-veneris TaxID=13818 RepID=A0A9D4UFZ8_ADICA|nr:hypothetical protein GOP47_0017747 [Adiantum capillus-veneris]
MEEVVELRVAMDCPGCERRIKRALYNIEGVHTVSIDRELQKVVVKGLVDRCEVFAFVVGLLVISSKELVSFILLN